jgi:alkanesulfonate monooxygenase SsuD/methylene tetrahydromethanopterin reductase-like flavin-dependent oxidoreductase (luciferase family)
MKLGLHISSQNPPETDPTNIIENLLEMVRTARDTGFNSILVPHHHLVDFHQFQPFPLLARIAAEAGTMRFGTGILVLPLLHPVVAAENIATLSVMSDRPVVVGVAVGYRDVEFESLDIPKSERGRRLNEGIEVMQRLWTESETTYHGEFFSLDGVSTNPQPPQPPQIWVGANTRPAIERAAREGDAWYINPHSTIAEIAQHKEHYDDIRTERGANTSVPMRREVFTSRDPEALALVRRHLARKYQHYLSWGQHKAMEDESELKQEFDDLAVDRFVIGTPEEVCEELSRYETELGVSEVVARVHFPGMPYEPALNCIELLGDEVIPYI